MRKSFLFAACALVCTLLFQSANAQRRPALTIDTIMRGPNFFGFAPQDLRWSGDNERLYFSWKQATDEIETPRDTYVLNRQQGAPVKLSEEEARLAPPVSAVWTKNRNQAVYTRGGDIYLYDYRTDKARALTRTADTEASPRFTRNEAGVTFVRDGNLYELMLSSGEIQQLTKLVPNGSKLAPKPPPDPNKIETSQDFLSKQEKALIEAIRDKQRLKDAAEALQKRENPLQAFELGAKQTATDILLCPDETCVIAMVDEEAKDPKNDNVPNYVTESSYTEDIPGRTNVGDLQSHPKLLILSPTGEGKWLDTGLGERAVTLTTPIFNEARTQAVLVARAVDNKDRWILLIDPSNAKARVLFTEHDDAWLGGPGEETLGWLKTSDDVYFQTERDGWSHLYTVPSNGGPVKQLTSGNFEVLGVELSRDGSKFYLTTNEGSAAEHHFYSMSVSGGARTRLTADSGSHEVVLSRDERFWADIYSYANKPPEIYIAENRAVAKGEKRTDSPARDFAEYAWQDPPLVQVPSRDGTMIPARFFKPAGYRPGGPAVVFVHGAGYLQNVHKFWSPNYPREWMFHHFLMEHGYMVLDLDYRASAGYGRDWRTGIYRFMGGKDLEDNVDGAKWLVAQGADAKRIGVYGGSYGGFITLMAMFTTPDVFAAGAALRPVTDWAHYNHEYTSNILNVPQQDADAYRKSSPIYFAEGLKGALLICHGMVDTNVFFQDTVRLVQRLIELRKENWSVAMYPVENHAFLKPSSWADEYKRIFQLFEANLKK